jgi:hypothetical protein
MRYSLAQGSADRVPVSPATQSASAFTSSHKSFIYRFYAESLANPFIYRIYANTPGLGGAHAERWQRFPDLQTFRRSDLQTLFCVASVFRTQCSLCCAFSGVVCFQQPAASFFLFALFLHTRAFVFSGLQPLLPKHPGVGGINRSASTFPTFRPSERSDLQTLFCSSFCHYSLSTTHYSPLAGCPWDRFRACCGRAF